MEIVAIISIVSVLAWFLVGYRNGVNLDNFTESQLKDDDSTDEQKK
jgi:hypothetical protein